MPRIRTIKPEFWTSEDVVACSMPARLLFIGIWNFADDAGIHPDNPMRLKMEIFPGDAIDVADVRVWLDELVANGLLRRYDVGDRSFVQVTGWQHQKIDKPNYRHPVPDESSNSRRTVAERSPNGSQPVVEESPADRYTEGIGTSTSKSTSTKARVRFQKPTLEEVKAYCEERGGLVDPNKWFAHYESNGWRVGKNPMKDWKASVRYWEQQRDEFARGSPATSKPGKAYTPISKGAGNAIF